MLLSDWLFFLYPDFLALDAFLCLFDTKANVLDSVPLQPEDIRERLTCSPVVIDEEDVGLLAQWTSPCYCSDAPRPRRASSRSISIGFDNTAKA